MNIERKVFSFFCWLVICVGASQRSMAEPLPIPEYFGTYAVVDGKLLKLDGQELNAERTAIVRMGQRNGIGNVVKHEPAAMPPKSVRIIELPADLKIVVFAQSGGLQSPLDIAKSLHLEPLVFVRTLTIDAGWPTSIKRSDPENGWDTGDAVELLVLAGGGERELEFLFKPMPGQKDMVVAGLAEKLKPGVYHLTLGGGGFFFAVQPVAEGESGKCVDALMTYAMMTADTKYTPCAGAPSTVTRAPTADSVEKSAAKTALSEKASPAIPSCISYDACLDAAKNSAASANYDTAVGEVNKAIALKPDDPGGWDLLAGLDIVLGHFSDATQAMDAVLSTGGKLEVPFCRTLFMGCDKGTLTLERNKVAFSASNGGFSAAVSEITDLSTQSGQYQTRTDNLTLQVTGVHLKARGKKFNLYFPGSGRMTCYAAYGTQAPACTQPGPAQQQVAAEYVVRTIPRLSTMDFKRPEKKPPAALACATSKDAGYSVLHGGKLYGVRTIGVSGKDTTIFTEAGGVTVTELSIVRPLAATAWTRTNILNANDIRAGSKRVIGILQTSHKLNAYQTVQDVIIRANVEAITAGITGGASLSKAFPNVVWGTVTAKLSEPRTFLLPFAEGGLSESRNAYISMEGLLPPSDASALDSMAVAHIRELYERASGLELTFSNLATALMPTRGTQLWAQAVKSAASGVLPAQAKTPQVVTARALLTMHTALAGASTGIQGWNKYRDGLNLALRLHDSNEKAIEELAIRSAAACQ